MAEYRSPRYGALAEALEASYTGDVFHASPDVCYTVRRQGKRGYSVLVEHGKEGRQAYTCTDRVTLAAKLGDVAVSTRWQPATLKPAQTAADEIEHILASLDATLFNLIESGAGYTDGLEQAIARLAALAPQVQGVALHAPNEPSPVVLDDIRDIGDEPGI
jgi:hypothetical protein